MFALADCNNFYASCQRVFEPSLNGKPVVILSNNDGCIIARSNEAKQLGIKMGEPAFKIEKFLAQNNVAVFSSNYQLYGDLSMRVMNVLGQFTPELEIYSIDEAFLNLDGLIIPLPEYAHKIKQTVLSHTGIPVSVGIGPTKVLAKAANHFAKKKPENHGVLVLDNSTKIDEALKVFPIEEVWGIGRQYAKLLTNKGIKTAWDFRQLSDQWVRKHLTIVGLRVKKELEGVSCLPLELIAPAKKAICTSRSFGEPQTELEFLNEAVATYTAKCAYKLRKQKLCAQTIMVFIHTNAFNPSEPQYAQNLVYTLPVATNSSLELIKYALHGLKLIYQKGYRYKKAGVIVSDTVAEDQVQGSLFDELDREKHTAVMKALDKLNSKYGQNTVKMAIQGTGQRWKLRQEKLSPCYTTRWNDIITVKV